MSDITKKSIGVLFDELVTTLIKCYMAQESIMNESLSKEERFEASLKTHELNNRRNQLIRAIDSILGGEASTVTDKSYAKHFKK